MKDRMQYDPYNLIITGVGGQGNVMASRVLGNIFSDAGYTVTIGETFGASQRGGSVMSHLRISSDRALSPQIGKGQAHLIIALEPTEALRVLADYGNEKVKVLCNNRPIYCGAVISGEKTYPEPEQLQEWIREFSGNAWFIDATDEALNRMKNPIFSNIIMLGALAATESIPLERDDFAAVISKSLPESKVEINLEAYDVGYSMIAKA